MVLYQRGKDPSNPSTCAVVGWTQYGPLLHRNSCVELHWHTVPEHCLWELPLNSDKSITELFLNDDSYWQVSYYKAAG